MEILHVDIVVRPYPGRAVESHVVLVVHHQVEVTDDIVDEGLVL